MKIPSNLPITAEQSRAARFQLGLTQAQVIEQSQLPGHKLKNFETGRFVPDMPFLQNLRQFYEGNAIDFTESPAPAAAANDDLQKPRPGAEIIEPALTSRFLVDPSITLDQVDAILERMDANDSRIAELMNRAVKSGFLSDYSEETEADTRELFGLMAENYLQFRALQGRNILSPHQDGADVKTQADLISKLFATTPAGVEQVDSEFIDEEEAA
ncbi:MAG: hypothetical protein ACYC05_10260 [Sulfuricella sp.]